jgi:hypothetical protein
VVAKYDELKTSSLPEDAKEKFLLRASTLSFFNTSKMDLGKMGQNDIKANLENYVQSFHPMRVKSSNTSNSVSSSACWKTPTCYLKW